MGLPDWLRHYKKSWLAQPGSEEYIALAALLAAVSGLLLLVLGGLRFGFLAHLLSHPVISGFISGSALLIALGQTKHLLGVELSAHNGFDVVRQLWGALSHINWMTLSISFLTIISLSVSKRYLSPMAGKLAPMLLVVIATWAVAHWRLADLFSVRVVGLVPQGNPGLRLPNVSVEQIKALALPALLLSLVGFVESVSVAQSLALKRKQKISPNKELLGLGAANLASALSGGMPVAGGFSRSVVNFSAGANTPLSGLVSAGLMTLVVSSLTSSFFHLPLAVLAATIVVAVLGLVDLDTLRRTWQYDRGDASAWLATFFGVLLLGVDVGIVIGMAMSLVVMVWRSRTGFVTYC